MKISRRIFLSLALFSAACSTGEKRPVEDGGVTIRLSTGRFSVTRVVDADNLEVEQTIENITILLTDPGSAAITHRYIDAGFSTVDDYRLVTLPDQPADLQTKDIYVVTNYDGSDLSTMTVITDPRGTKTPIVNKSDNLDPAKGICMYGKTTGFDFTSGRTAEVYVERTCAKVRVTMTFPDNPGLSTENAFLIANVASYTHISDEAGGLVLTTDDYFNFASELPLTDNGSGEYTGIAYIYEASAHPVLHVYTHIGGSAAAQEYWGEMHLPERNHLYDCDVRVFYDDTTDNTTRQGAEVPYTMEIRTTGYGPDGKVTDYGVRRFGLKQLTNP